MDRTDRAQERTSEVTELKKLFTMPRGSKQLRRDVNITEKVCYTEYRMKMSYVSPGSQKEVLENVGEIQKIMDEKFPELTKDTNLQFQDPKVPQAG